METIKVTTKRGQSFINAYSRSRAANLCEVYSSWSTEKQIAYNNCRKKFVEECGKGFKIIAAARYFFTVAWETTEGDLRVITAKGSYIVK